MSICVWTVLLKLKIVGNNRLTVMAFSSESSKKLSSNDRNRTSYFNGMERFSWNSCRFLGEKLLRTAPTRDHDAHLYLLRLRCRMQYVGMVQTSVLKTIKQFNECQILLNLTFAKNISTVFTIGLHNQNALYCKQIDNYKWHTWWFVCAYTTFYSSSQIWSKNIFIILNKQKGTFCC